MSGKVKKTKSGKSTVFILMAILAFTAAVRLRLADMPLERDEGEFAYQARLILQGEAPYQSAYNKKLPGVSFAYALGFLLFGDSARSIKLTLLLANALAILALFAISRRLYGPFAALTAAGAYALLSLGSNVLGHAGHATQFMNLFMLVAVLFLVLKDPPPWGWTFLAGLMLGAAAMMKQHALLFAPVMLLFLVSSREKRRFDRLFWMRTVVLGAAASLPYLLLVALMISRGLLDRFIFWTVHYAGGYRAADGLKDILEIMIPNISLAIGPMWPLWILGLAGITFRALSKGPARERFFPAGSFLFLLLSTVPGFFFRNHYFIAVLPAVAVGAGLAVQSFHARLDKRVGSGTAGFFSFLIMAAIGTAVLLPQSDFLFRRDPTALSRMIYGANPFAESPVIGEFLEKNSSPGDTIAVLGSEAQIYYYSRRRAATGYIYTYGLMDGRPYNRRMQTEMASEIEKAEPRFLVMVNIPTSWTPNPAADTWILQWINEITRTRYRLVGLVDIRPDGTVYRWHKEAADHKPSHIANLVLVFEKASPDAPE